MQSILIAPPAAEPVTLAEARTWLRVDVNDEDAAIGSLISAAVLISVGVWMHGKGQADAWQTYIKEKLSAALSKRSAWFLFLLAFMVVYREVFETILFYAAMWSQGARTAILAGAAAAETMLQKLHAADIGEERAGGEVFAFLKQQAFDFLRWCTPLMQLCQTLSITLIG